MTNPAPPQDRLGNHVLFVVATAAQSGKSTVSRRIAERLGLPVGMTSAVISEQLEARLGLPAGSIAAARKNDPERYRAEIVAEGDGMRAAGRSPGEVCVDRGYRLVDGIRVASELAAAATAARERGMTPFVLCIERPGVHPSDNTEPEALRAMADAVFDNDGSLERLYAQVETLLARLSRGEAASSD